MDNIDIDILTKRFQTTMIGALFEFEENFGYLWGLEKEDHELTKQELYFREKWNDTRNRVLNNGNNQLRKCLSDLKKYHQNTINYSYKFHQKGQ